MPAFMQPPDWKDVQAFLAVARAGQLARAAAAAAVDPTTIGRRLRRLESVLGQTLFEQTREGQILTEAGERLLVSAEAMQKAADAIAGQSMPTDQLAGQLRVSVSEGFGSWFVAAHLADFARAHPALTIDLVATSGFLSPSKRETDVAVLLARPRTGHVVARKLTDYALRAYAAADYLASRTEPRTIAELQRHRLVGYIPDLLYAPELRYLAELDPQLVPTIRSSSINAQHQLIASGAGVGVLPTFIGHADPRLRPILPATIITRSFWIVTHEDTQRLQRVRLFRDWLTATVRRHGDRLTGV